MIVKTRALPAAPCVVEPEKKLVAPLTWAALSQPVEEVNVLNDEPVLTAVTVIPVIGVAALFSDSAAKSKLARVAA